MLYTGFQVSYNGKTIYDCRIIEAEDLGQTLRDFCNRAAKDAPIVTVFGDESGINVDIYTGRNNTVKPQLVKYLYIKEPAKVKFDEDREEIIEQTYNDGITKFVCAGYNIPSSKFSLEFIDL